MGAGRQENLFAGRKKRHRSFRDDNKKCMGKHDNVNVKEKSLLP
jgi:hypothetical protein